MTTLKQIMDVLEAMAPLSLQQATDNSGLQCGDEGQPIRRMLLCVDCTDAVVQEAIENDVQLILSHHPLVFDPLKCVSEQQGLGRVLRALIKHDIALYAAHTNMDFVQGGLCDVLAEMFELRNTVVVQPMADGHGYGRLGDIEPIAIHDLAARAKALLQSGSVSYTGASDTVITKLAVHSGSGMSAAADAFAAGAQCVLTGDVKYGQALGHAREGQWLIDAGHFDSEKVMLPVWQSDLQTRFNLLQYTIDVLVARSDRDVFTHV